MKGRNGLARFKFYVYARRYIHCLYFGKRKSAELKRQVERGSTFTITSYLSFISSILFYARTHIKITRSTGNQP